MYEPITMECSACKRRNYSTKKNRRTQKERLKRRKFCPWCGKHTEHIETK